MKINKYKNKRDFAVKEITLEDVNMVLKENTLTDYLEAGKIMDLIIREQKKDIDNFAKELEQIAVLFNLGIIEGKRLERARRNRGGDSKMILINTTNPLKKKAINRVLNISDDKLEEVINIIDMINALEMKVDDIKNIKFLIGGVYKPKKIILKVHTTKRKG